MSRDCLAVIEELITEDDYYSGHWCVLAADHDGPHKCGGSNCTVEWDRRESDDE